MVAVLLSNNPWWGRETRLRFRRADSFSAGVNPTTSAAVSLTPFPNAAWRHTCTTELALSLNVLFVLHHFIPIVTSLQRYDFTQLSIENHDRQVDNTQGRAC